MTTLDRETTTRRALLTGAAAAAGAIAAEALARPLPAEAATETR